jgi:hypothetical protein
MIKACPDEASRLPEHISKEDTASPRSLWVNISPRNPLLKPVVAVPAAAIMLTMLILIMIIAGFTLIAVAPMLASSGKPRKGNNR